MKIFTIIIMLLIPALALGEQIIRDKSGSVAYTKQRFGNQIIYRDRSGAIIGTENLYGRQKYQDRDRVKAPLLK